MDAAHLHAVANLMEPGREQAGESMSLESVDIRIQAKTSSACPAQSFETTTRSDHIQRRKPGAIHAPGLPYSPCEQAPAGVTVTWAELKNIRLRESGFRFLHNRPHPPLRNPGDSIQPSGQDATRASNQPRRHRVR